MQTDALAHVYARSLFELAEEAGGIDKIVELGEELEQICRLVRAEKQLAEFFASPIIYSLDGLEAPSLLVKVLALNPLASLVAVYRDLVFSGKLPSLASWVTALVVGLVSWWLGSRIFAHYRETLVEAV